MTQQRASVVLVSGGMDSAVVLAHVIAEGYLVHALSFNYGQRHDVELTLARRLAQAHGVVKHRVISLDASAFQGSALTDGGDVPMDRVGDLKEIPVTYVPARNLVFLSMATAYAESIGAADIFLGVNAVDYSGYPDCRPEFIDAFQRTANLGTRVGVEGEGPSIRIHAPLIDMSKADIVRRGAELGVDFAMTSSCYTPQVDGDGFTPCRRCDACRLRAGGFQEAGLIDGGLERQEV